MITLHFGQLTVISLFRIFADQLHCLEELKFMVDLDMTSFLLVGMQLFLNTVTGNL